MPQANLTGMPSGPIPGGILFLSILNHQLHTMAKKLNTEEGVSEEIVTIVVVVTSPLAEGGNHYIPGETFETTPERAAALGDLVKPVE